MSSHSEDCIVANSSSCLVSVSTQQTDTDTDMIFAQLQCLPGSARHAVLALGLNTYMPTWFTQTPLGQAPATCSTGTWPVLNTVFTGTDPINTLHMHRLAPDMHDLTLRRHHIPCFARLTHGNPSVLTCHHGCQRNKTSGLHKRHAQDKPLPAQPDSFWSCMHRSARAHERGSRVGWLLTRAPAAAGHPRLPREAVAHAVPQRRAAAAVHL